MTVRVERSFEIAADPERVWEFIADPERRARAISVVEDFRLEDPEGRRATWYVRLPIPFVKRTITIDTRDVTRRPPEYVEFRGTSKVLSVTGEHEIVPTDDGVRLENAFVVDGKVPGVEQFFKRNLDDELENLHAELERYVEDTRA